MPVFLTVEEEAALELLTRAPGPSLGAAPRYPLPRPRPRPARPGAPVPGAPGALLPSLVELVSDVERLELGASHSGEFFMGASALVAPAANQPHIQLFNPAGGNRRLQVYGAFGSVRGAAAILRLGFLSSPLTTFEDRPENLDLGGPPSGAELRSQSDPNPLGTLLGFFQGAVNSPFNFIQRGSIEVDPGRGLHVSCDTLASTIDVLFYFREAPVL